MGVGCASFVAVSEIAAAVEVGCVSLVAFSGVAELLGASVELVEGVDWTAVTASGGSFDEPSGIGTTIVAAGAATVHCVPKSVKSERVVMRRDLL